MATNRLKVVLIISIVCWIILTLFIIFLLWLSRLNVTDKPNMIGKSYEDVTAVYYSSDGDRRNPHESFKLITDKEVNLKLTYYKCPSNKASGELRTVEVSQSILEEINVLFYRYGVSDQIKSKNNADEIDTNTEKITFVTNRKRYDIYSGQKQPENAEEIISESYNILMRYYKNQ